MPSLGDSKEITIQLKGLKMVEIPFPSPDKEHELAIHRLEFGITYGGGIPRNLRSETAENPWTGVSVTRYTMEHWEIVKDEEDISREI